MKAAVYPADVGGCGYYRVINATEELIRQGHDIDLVMPNEPAERQMQAAWRERFDGVAELVDVIVPDVDVVVFQRPLRGYMTEAIRILQQRGIRVVVEIDDDFTSISKRNVSYRSVDPKQSPARNWAHLAEACSLADLVTVSTPRLAEVYGAHGRVRIVPNYIPAAYLDAWREDHDGMYVGWSGSTETHPDDLQVTGGGVARAIERCGATMAIVGTGRGVKDAMGLNTIPMSCGWRQLDDYPDAIAQFDVGIVPLEASPFNEAKSWLKGLEYAAVGVPFVATPTGPYRALAEMGAGLLAETPRQWEGIVKRLLRDDDYRHKVAAQGRSVAARMTVEAHAHEWWDAWRSVVNTPAAASVA